MNELALFAGAGGGILGGKLLGWKTVCAVENDPYARDVLVSRQNDGCLDPFPIWDDVCTFDGRPWKARVDVVSGGFPCQDISSAGKGAGIQGERSGLWGEMARIISEVRPRYVFAENSPLLVQRGLAVVLCDLAEMGYDARWGVVGAHHVTAPHKRDRIWIVAHSQGNRIGREPRNICKTNGRQDGSVCGQPICSSEESSNMANTMCNRLEGPGSELSATGTERESENVADAMCERGKAGTANPQGRQEGDAAKPVNCCDLRHAAGEGLQNGTEQQVGEPGTDTESERSDWWATEPDMGRVAHGVANRVDRLRCIGNGQVPQVAALAWRLLC